MTRLLFEIENIKKCDSRYVISTYGATYFNNQISCFMEYMDIGSLDVILYEINRVPERIMSRIVRNVIIFFLNYFSSLKICMISFN